jgi:hypothetical protein
MESTVRASVRALGLLLIGVAAWGGVVAFVGPSFGFRLGNTTAAWVWNESHATLHFAPGVAGLIGGLLMLIATTRAMERVGGVLALTSGAWFLIGPSLEPLWHSGATTATLGSSGSTTMRVLEGIGYQYGTGAVMVALAAFALGLLAPGPVAARATTPAPTGTRRRPRRPSFRHVSNA